MSSIKSIDRQVQRVILIEGAANLLVLITKVLIGLSTGSMAILADAVHSLSDLINNFIAWFVMYFSSKPADREHPYGHRKFETLAVFILGSILVVLAFNMALTAVMGDNTPEIVSSTPQLIIMICVLFLNIGVTTWQHHWATRLDSDILRADASHTFADVLITTAVIAGWQFSAAGYLWADRLCTFAVSVFVFLLAYKLFRRALPILVDEYAVDPVALSRCVKTISGVKDVYNVRSRWIGKKPAIDMVISVTAELSTEESHSITDNIEALIESEFNTSDITIHVEPDHLTDPPYGRKD